MKQQDEEVIKDFQDMVNLSEKVSAKTQQLKQRVKVLQDALKKDNEGEDEGLKTENTVDEEFDRHASLEILDDLIAEAQKDKSSSKKGYHISPKQLQTFQDLQINYHILSEQFTQMKSQNQDLAHFKLQYNINQQKWNKKVEATAGDVSETVKYLSSRQVLDTERIQELEQ